MSAAFLDLQAQKLLFSFPPPLSSVYRLFLFISEGLTYIYRISAYSPRQCSDGDERGTKERGAHLTKDKGFSPMFVHVNLPTFSGHKFIRENQPGFTDVTGCYRMLADVS